MSGEEKRRSGDTLPGWLSITDTRPSVCQHQGPGCPSSTLLFPPCPASKPLAASAASSKFAKFLKTLVKISCPFYKAASEGAFVYRTRSRG